MNLEIFSRQLRLFSLLAGNMQLTVKEVCRQVGISSRTFYRYIAMFRASDFEVSEARGGIYSIDFSSSFFNSFAEKMRLSRTEVQTLSALLERADPSLPGIQRLMQRMRTVYGVEFDPGGTRVDALAHENTDTLMQAISRHQQAVLHDYDSPHSHTLGDRLVEPFQLLAQQRSVRCYEVESQQCKTFKIARIRQRVELLPQKWQWRGRHVGYHTDLFGFSAEETHRVVLRLGPLSTRILMEEYGVRETQLVIDGDPSRRLFATSVCSLEGVGRFVLGLISDIEVVKGRGLQLWLHRQLRDAQRRLFP